MGINVESDGYFASYSQMAWPERLHFREILLASQERIRTDAVLCWTCRVPASK